MRAGGVNLVPRALLNRRAERAWRARWGLVIAGSAALTAIGTAGLRLGSDAGLRTARSDVDRMGAQRLEIQADLARMRDLIARANASAGAARLLEDRPDWGLLLAMLDEHREERVAISRVELRAVSSDGSLAAPARAARIELSISGIGRELQQVQAYALQIEQSGLFDAVSPIRTSPVSSQAGASVAFELDLELHANARVAEVSP
ncbi:MAG: hypothetical protein RIB60_09160 [Phycisphaerales bacterium]